jgi:hypothetical protein
MAQFAASLCMHFVAGHSTADMVHLHKPAVWTHYNCSYMHPLQLHVLVFRRFTCDDGCTGKAQWVLSSEGPCSKTCGGGVQERTFSCRGYWDPGSCSEWLRRSL